MINKSLKVIYIILISGFFVSQQIKGCDNSKEYIKEIIGISSSSLSEIKIEKKNINQIFIDSWIDVESSQETVPYDEIKILTIKECKLSKNVSYDIFNSFVNLKELNILKCNIDSKCLNNLLRGINPYSLSILNLSGSNFNFFDEKDFLGINSLFSLSKIIIPLNMDKSSQQTLEKLFDQPKLINSDNQEDKHLTVSQDEIIRIKNKISKYEGKLDYLKKLMQKLQVKD
jgi:hypothetical protein